MRRNARDPGSRITRRKVVAFAGSAAAWSLTVAAAFGAGGVVELSEDDFRAWYDGDAPGRIVVAGRVTEIDGSTATLVRAEPQGINPRMLMLKLHVAPFAGRLPPHTAVQKALRYEEPAEKGAFTDVHVERAGGGFTLKVDAAPR